MSDGPRYLHQLKLTPENVEFQDLNIGDLVEWQYVDMEVAANRFNSMNGRGCVVFRKEDGSTVQVPYATWQHKCCRRIGVPMLLPLTDEDLRPVVEQMRLALNPS